MIQIIKIIVFIISGAAIIVFSKGIIQHLVAYVKFGMESDLNMASVFIMMLIICIIAVIRMSD